MIVDEDFAGLTAADVDGVDAILIYHTQTKASAEMQQVLGAWVAEGKPLIIVHAGIGVWPEWSNYTAGCGNVWDWISQEKKTVLQQKRSSKVLSGPVAGLVIPFFIKTRFCSHSVDCCATRNPLQY